MSASSTMKVAFQFVADAAGLVGGIRVAREELDRLGKTASTAANDTSAALHQVGGGASVVPLEAHRRSMQGLSADMGEASARAHALQQAAAASVSTHRDAAGAITQAANAARGYHDAAGGAEQGTSRFAGAMSTLAMGLRTMAGLGIVSTIVSTGAAMINAAAQAQQMERRLASLVGTGAELRENQQWLSKTADRLGQSTVQLSDSYVRLLNLQRSGLVTTGQARDLTEGLANAQVKYAADAGRMGDVMYGLSQALASPTLHMEELNQVTEPLPGLLMDLDKAAGLPSGGFRKLVNEGRVTSEMFRDTLLKALKGYAGEAERASGSVEAAYARMENARERFLANGGKQLIDGWANLVNAGTAGINAANDTLSWATRRSVTGDMTVARIQLDQLLEERKALEADRARYAAGAGGVYAKRNVQMADQQLTQVESQIDAVLAKLRTLEAKLGDATDGWAEMWGTAATGGTRSVVDQLAPKLADVADAIDLVVTKNGLLTKSEVELRTQTGVLSQVLALPPDQLKKLGITANDATFMLDRLAEKSSVVVAAIAGMNRATATVAVAPKWRDLYTTLDKATEDKGRPLTDDESADLTGAWRKKRNADSAEQVRLSNEAAAAANRLAQAQASGSPAAVAAARADLQVAEALRDGVIVQADKASYHTAKLQENMAGLAGQAGEAATTSSRQARQALELAAATEQGGAAAAAASLRHQIENETLKVGAGAHSELARRLTEEDAARRKLAGAQWNRDMDLQIQAAKALAEAEGRGTKAVADATVANQTASQVEKEGVAVDGERAKAIGAKAAELAKWQERQNYARSLRESDDDIALLQRELSLQGEGETIRTRTLELARAELDIRRQFPNATEAEVAALLRKHETAIHLREEIAQQRGLWDELGRLGERAFDRVGSAITEAFAQGKASTISWGSVAKAVMSEVIQAALQLTVINPMKNWVTGGSAPSIWSALGTSQGGGQGASGGSLLSNGASTLTNTALSKAGSWAADKLGLSSGLDSVMNYPLWGSAVSMSSVGAGSTVIGTASPIIGQATGAIQAGSLNAANGIVNAGNTAALNASYSGTASGAAGTAGGTLAGVMGAAGAGAFGGGLVGGTLGTATNSKVVGGLSGAVAGAGSAYLATLMGISSLGGPIGLAIGAVVGAIMGMLGTQKATVGPNSSGNITLNGSGGFRTDTALADNGADAAQMQSVTNAAATAMNTIITGIGAKLTGGDGANTGLLQQFAKDGKWYVTPAVGENAGKRTEFTDQDQAIQYYMRESLRGLIANGQLTGANDDVKTALRTSKATKAEDLAADLGFASNFRQQFEILNASLDPTNNQIKTFTEQAKTLGDQIKTNISDWRAKASELGLATEGALTVAARRGIEAMMGLGPAVQPLAGLAAVSKQAEINVEAFRPALASLGYTAAEQADIIGRYTQKLKDDYIASVQLVQRQGAAALAGLTNPSAGVSMSDRFRSGLGLDPTVAAVSGLVTTMQSVEAAAGRGALTMGQMQTALAQIDSALMAGTISGEQYSTLVNSLTTAWSTASGVLGALRQGAIAVEQAIDPSWRANLDARLSDTGMSGAAIEALRPTWQAVLAGATAGAASAAQMRTALAALDGQLRAGTITVDQHKSAVGILTAAWQDNTAAVSAAADQVASTWSSLLSTAIQDVSESWRTVASDAQQAATSWGNVADSLAQTSRDVMADKTYSNLKPEGLRDAAKEEFDRLRGIITTYADAQKAGTATDAQRTAALDAAGRLDDAGKKYLEAQRAYSGDGTAYDQTLADVRKVWDGTGQLGLTLKTAETKRAEAAEATISRLEQLTGIGSAQRALLGEIKTAIGSGNTNMTELLALIRQTPGYQRYSAPADVQSRWDGMSSDVQRSVAHTLGYASAPTDAAFNDYIVANGLSSQFETLVRSGAGGVDRSGVTWLEDFWGRYRAGLSLPEGERSSLFSAMVAEKERVLGSLPAAAFRPMYERAVQLPDTDIDLNIEEAARRRGIPGFRDGGWHSGGPRLVGERGMEIEATGPARYWSHEQTRDILSPKVVTVDMAPVVTAIGGVRAAVLEIGGQIAAMAARIVGLEGAVDGLAAEQRLLGNKIMKLVTR